MYKIFLTAAVSYFIGAAGLFGGAALALFLPGVKRWRNAGLSLAGGMAGALVCFEFFPAAAARSGLYFTMAATMAGILLAYLAEMRISGAGYNETFFYLLSCGVAAGLFLNGGGIRLSIPVIIAGCCVPSGIELMSDRTNQSGIGLDLFFPLRLSLIMAAGGFAGALIGQMPPPIPAALLAASAGVILYISCGAGRSESDSGGFKEIISWAATLAGFVFAVILIL